MKNQLSRYGIWAAGFALGCFVAQGQGAPQKVPAAKAAATKRGASSAQERRARQEWVAQCLMEMQSIKLGMTRKDLFKVFTTEGGLYSASQGHFVHRECPYFKVDVEFATARDAQGRDVARASDKIIKVSRPYLQLSIMD